MTKRERDRDREAERERNIFRDINREIYTYRDIHTERERAGIGIGTDIYIGIERDIHRDNQR